MPSDPARTRRTIAILSMAVATAPLSLHAFLPALPHVARDLGIDTATAQLSVSLPILAFGPALLLYGPLSDRYGRRAMLLAGLLIFTAGSLFAGCAPDIEWLVAGRILQAAGAAAGVVLTRAIVADTVAPNHVAGTLARVMLVVVLVPMFTPLAAGVTAEAAGWRVILLALGAFGLVVAVLVLVRLLTGPTEIRRTDLGRQSVLTTLRSRSFVAYSMLGACSLAVFFGFITIAPFLTTVTLGRSGVEYGAWFATLAVSYLAGNAIVARIGHRHSNRGLARVGAALGLVSMLPLGAFALAGIDHPWQLFVPMMGYTLASGLMAPASQAGAVEGGTGHVGLVSSVFGAIQQTTGAAVIQTAGVLETIAPYNAIYLLLAIAFGGACAAWSAPPRSGVLDTEGLDKPV